jgi:hypothetical protein
VLKLQQEVKTLPAEQKAESNLPQHLVFQDELQVQQVQVMLLQILQTFALQKLPDQHPDLLPAQVLHKQAV